MKKLAPIVGPISFEMFVIYFATKLVLPTPKKLKRYNTNTQQRKDNIFMYRDIIIKEIIKKKN